LATALLKEIASGITQPFLHIINLSFSSGVFPDELQIARAIPVYKKGEHFLTQNYGPISIVIVPKILEKLMAKRVSDFLTNNSVLYSHQFEFRQKYSTVLALIDVIGDIYIYIYIYPSVPDCVDTVRSSIVWTGVYISGDTIRCGDVPANRDIDRVNAIYVSI